MAYTAWSVSFGEQPSAAKWNILGTNDASFNNGTGIAVSAITPEKLLTGTGTSWAWTSFTPSWTNLTVGNGTQTAAYIQIGKTVLGSLKFIMGSTSSVGTNPYFTPPVAASSSYHTNIHPIGSGCAYDGSAFYLITPCFRNSIARIEMLATGAGGTYVNYADLTGTAPATWNTNDVFMLSFAYQAA